MRRNGIKGLCPEISAAEKEAKEPKPVCCWLALALLKLKELHRIPEVQNVPNAP